MAEFACVCLVLNRTLPSKEFPVLRMANLVSSDPLFCVYGLRFVAHGNSLTRLTRHPFGFCPSLVLTTTTRFFRAVCLYLEELTQISTLFSSISMNGRH